MPTPDALQVRVAQGCRAEGLWAKGRAPITLGIKKETESAVSTCRMRRPTHAAVRSVWCAACMGRTGAERRNHAAWPCDTRHIILDPAGCADDDTLCRAWCWCHTRLVRPLQAATELRQIYKRPGCPCDTASSGGQLCGRRTIIGPSPACRGTSTHVWGHARADGRGSEHTRCAGGGARAHHLPEKPVHDLSPCRVVLHPEPAVNHVSSQEVSQHDVPARCTFHEAICVGEQLDSPLVALSRHAAHRGRT